MGFNILDENRELITKIDLDIKDNPFYIECNINDVNRKYSSLEKIMTDKLLSLSGTHVFRRTKDLLDVFLIIKNHQIDTRKVEEILNYESKNLGDFSTMISNKSLLEESYNKLERITNKPSFDEVWDSIIAYLENNNLIEISSKNGTENKI